ncbi:MAG: endonuclease/exonuclease/phosphatase family protein [Paludibacter sp.]
MRKLSFLLLLAVFTCLVNAQNRELKVSTFNIRNDNQGDADNGNGWQNRYPVIAGMILFNDMDIVGTQECKNNQVIDLKNAMAKYNYSYIGRGRGANPTDDEYSAIFYKTNRFSLISSGNFWLSQTPDVPSKGWDAALNRICTWGKFKEKTTGFVFFVFNLHMDHIGVEARKNSSILVLKKMKELAQNLPVCLTGDFNVDQYSEGYKILTTSGMLSDSYLVSPIVYDPNGTFNSFEISNTTNQRIDHVFVSKQFKPARYGVLTELYWSDKSGRPSHPRDFPAETTVVEGTPRLPSDHYPVMVALKY